MSTAPPALELRTVVKRYGSGTTEVRALTDVNLTIAAGQLVAVMGPSGCGKSTLLHIAGALEPVDAGAVSVFGTDLSTLDAKGRAALRCSDVGFVFQRLNLLPSLTALENVMLPLELQGQRMRSAKSAAKDALAAVGVTDQLDRHPDDFSGGQQQRIAIARAIVGDRRLILADEPTGALDSTTSDLVIEILAGLPAATGATVVLVTHEPRFAGWADRVIFLRDGRVIDEAVADSLDVSGPDALDDADLTAGAR